MKSESNEIEASNRTKKNQMNCKSNLNEIRVEILTKRKDNIKTNEN